MPKTSPSRPSCVPSALSQLRDAERADRWLLRIARNEFLRSPRRRLAHMEVDVPAPDVVAIEDAEEIAEALARAGGGVPAPLLLFYFEELSYREIAEELGIPLGTVMSRLSRGRDYLRERLTPESAPKRPIPPPPAVRFPPPPAAESLSGNVGMAVSTPIEPSWHLASSMGSVPARTFRAIAAASGLSFRRDTLTDPDECDMDCRSALETLETVPSRRLQAERMEFAAFRCARSSPAGCAASPSIPVAWKRTPSCRQREFRSGPSGLESRICDRLEAEPRKRGGAAVVEAGRRPGGAIVAGGPDARRLLVPVDERLADARTGPSGA